MAEMGSDSEVLETDAVPDTDQELTKTFQAQSIHDRSRNADSRPAAVEKSNTPEERLQISVAEEDHQQSDNEVDDLDMKKYRGRLPPELQADHHDGVILYFDRSDDDSIGAKNFLHDIMTKVELDGGEKPKVALFHDILPFTMALTNTLLLEIIIKRSTIKFLYITESFCKDAWEKFAASVYLMDSIENEEWSVFPIFTTDKYIKPRPYYISPAITGLKGLNNYNSTTFPTEDFRNMFQAKLEYRMAQNADIEKKRIDAIKEMKDQEQKKSQGTIQASTISPQTTPPFSVTDQPQTSSPDAPSTSHTPSSDARATAQVSSLEISYGVESSRTGDRMEAHTISPRALERRGSPSEHAPEAAERVSSHVSAKTGTEEAGVNDAADVSTEIPMRQDSDGGASKSASARRNSPPPKYCEHDLHQVQRPKVLVQNIYYSEVRNEYGMQKSKPTTVNINELSARTVMVGEKNQQIRSIQPDSDGADTTSGHTEEESVAEEEVTKGVVQETRLLEPETTSKYGSGLAEFFTPPRSPVSGVHSEDVNSDDEDTLSKMA